MQARLAKARMLATLDLAGARDNDDDLDMPEIENDFVDYKEPI